VRDADWCDQPSVFAFAPVIIGAMHDMTADYNRPIALVALV
jgi:cyanate permease